ncbi:PH domain-containing protein [Lutimonas saemankumensis]|uniref:PH domain-containing protein n=1 Tax=Lutimonas saemankumensis TaxID=483016 RepID=UPI001CD655A5|nr:PH domain-containing protein [Lutimonas saemankumensis]MCA0932779.1 PH domain-containing protein [Lutimonas saemankumensis]
MNQGQIIKEAEFSLKIKTYILLTVSFFLLITIIGIPILIIWLLGLGQYVSRRYYENLKCTLTDRHLIFSKGAFFKVEKTIPLENIQDLTFLQNPILNLLELKILKIETAGGSNPDGSDMKLIGIVGSEEFKRMVLEEREVLVRKPKTEETQDKDLETLTVLREIRDLLKDLQKSK